MLVRQFIAQYVGAQPFQPPAERGRAAAAIAGALVRGELPQDEEDDALVALAAALDDPSPIVRAALARELSVACNAPHHIIVALANDQADVAAPVLNRSPRLTDTDLIDCVAACEPASQIAVATRHRLSPAVRAQLVDAAAAALSRFATQCGWLSEERARRAAREAREKAIVQIAADASASANAASASVSAGEDEPHGALALARYLRAQGQLTAGLVLRALLSGERGLLEAALSELSGLPLARVSGLVRDGRGAGFAALFARAGMPAGLLPAFRAALAAQADLGEEIGADPEAGARLSRLMIERVLTSCERLDDSALAPVLALLRRFDAEAAREDARERLGAGPAPRARPAPGEKPRPMSVAELRSRFRKALAA